MKSGHSSDSIYWDGYMSACGARG